MPRIFLLEPGCPLLGVEASMRPGHFAPDIYPHNEFSRLNSSTRFNEAGAFCPGYLPDKADAVAAALALQ